MDEAAEVASRAKASALLAAKYRTEFVKPD
jgi:hypothetical protein